MAVMRNSGIKDSTGDRMLMTGIYICLAIILLLVLYPLLWVVSASVSDPFMIRQGKLWLMPVGFQLKGYQLAFSDSEILLGYRNSLFYMIAGTAINIFLTTIAAFPLSCKDFKARNVLALFFSFTMWFNGGHNTQLHADEVAGLYQYRLVRTDIIRGQRVEPHHNAQLLHHQHTRRTARGRQDRRLYQCGLTCSA